ncbi:MAG: hypothetical protein ACJ72Z_00450 [Pyrinomonadaceae bacterium]
MSAQNASKENETLASESGYNQDKKDQKGSKSDSLKGGGTGTATGRSMENKDSTGTAPQNPGTSRQNPGTSGRDEDVTGDATEKSGQTTSEQPIRNPSGEDLGNAIDGDEGSGRGF